MTDPIEYLRIQVGGSKKLYAFMIDTFSSAYKQDLIDIKQAIKDRNINRLNGFSHKFKNQIIYFYPLDHEFIRTIQQLQDTEKINRETVHQFKNIVKYTSELVEVLGIKD